MDWGRQNLKKSEREENGETKVEEKQASPLVSRTPTFFVLGTMYLLFDNHDSFFIFSDLLGKTKQNLKSQILFFCITCSAIWPWSDAQQDWNSFEWIWYSWIACRVLLPCPFIPAPPLVTSYWLRSPWPILETEWTPVRFLLFFSSNTPCRNDCDMC